MRHLLSLIAGLVIAPVAWLLVGLGQTKLSDVNSESATADWGLPLALLAAAGLLIGLIASTRLSPAGPVLAGLIFLGAQGVFVWDPSLVVDNTPDSILGEKLVAAIPAASGTGMLLGVVMLVSVFSVARWRGAPQDDGFGAPAPPQNDLFGASRPSLATSAAAENRGFPSTYQPLGGRGSGTESPAYPAISGRRGTTYGGETDGEGEETVRINQDSPGGGDATTVFPSTPSQPSGGDAPRAGGSGGAPLWPGQAGQSGSSWPTPPPPGQAGTSPGPGAWPQASQNPWSQPPGGGSDWPDQSPGHSR